MSVLWIMEDVTVTHKLVKNRAVMLLAPTILDCMNAVAMTAISWILTATNAKVVSTDIAIRSCIVP